MKTRTLLSIFAIAATVGAFGGTDCAEAGNGQGYLRLSGFSVYMNDPAFENVSTGVKSDVGVKDGFGGAVALGFRLPNYTRAEVEGYYRRNDIDDPAVEALGPDAYETYGAMANLYYDLPFSRGFMPYIGGGAGYARLKTGDVFKDDVFAYQGMAGAQFFFRPNTALTVGYRYFATQDARLTVGSGRVDASYETHNAEAGLSFGF
ncbi:MAG: outer membrane beta-barrel protein [Rickettsiales bacterium]